MFQLFIFNVREYWTIFISIISAFCHQKFVEVLPSIQTEDLTVYYQN